MQDILIKSIMSAQGSVRRPRSTPPSHVIQSMKQSRHYSIRGSVRVIAPLAY